jgi:hypothetical protein
MLIKLLNKTANHKIAGFSRLYEKTYPSPMMKIRKKIIRNQVRRTFESMWVYSVAIFYKNYITQTGFFSMKKPDRHKAWPVSIFKKKRRRKKE